MTSFLQSHVREPSWKKIIADEFQKKYFLNLSSWLEKEYEYQTIYPKKQDIFEAFNACPFEKIKVVILGQDPYHGEGQAHGLAFSVKNSNNKKNLPPSLKNIFKEIESDLGGVRYVWSRLHDYNSLYSQSAFSRHSQAPRNGDLSGWVKQGVFLLNATLTVQAHSPQSHYGKGWELLTDFIIKKISDEHNHIVFLLWGSEAQQKKKYIDSTRHCVLTAPHPSPLSAYRGFFGCKHFSATNEYLKKWHGPSSCICW